MLDYRLSTAVPNNNFIEQLIEISQKNTSDSWAALCIISYCRGVPVEALLPLISAKVFVEIKILLRFCRKKCSIFKTREAFISREQPGITGDTTGI